MIGKPIANPNTHSSFKALNDYITGKSKRRLEDAGEKIAFTGCLNLIHVRGDRDAANELPGVP